MTQPDLHNKRLLAFCHIEKAAGTSLIHILRRVFFLRYAAVRPMTSRDKDTFTLRDLKTVLRINPFLSSFGGHAVVPYGDILQSPCQLQFITQVREPIQRAVSQYKFWVNRMSLGTSWQEFLRHPVSRNFQVRKIAGTENLDLAQSNIVKHFVLAGTVDQFDTFLVLLAHTLRLPLELFTYQVQNTDQTATKVNLPQQFFDGLRERNQLDQQLYEWIRKDLVPTYFANYEGDFSLDLGRFRSLQHSSAQSKRKVLIDFMYRNAYLKPVSGMIRVAHGLPYRGSYARH